MFTSRLCFRFVEASTRGQAAPYQPQMPINVAVNWPLENLTQHLSGAKLLCPFVPSVIPCEGPELFQIALPFLRPHFTSGAPRSN